MSHKGALHHPHTPSQRGTGRATTSAEQTDRQRDRQGSTCPSINNSPRQHKHSHHTHKERQMISICFFFSICLISLKTDQPVHDPMMLWRGGQMKPHQVNARAVGEVVIG